MSRGKEQIAQRSLRSKFPFFFFLARAFMHCSTYRCLIWGYEKKHVTVSDGIAVHRWLGIFWLKHLIGELFEFI